MIKRFSVSVSLMICWISLEWGKSLNNKIDDNFSKMRSSSGSHSSYQCESTVGDTFSSFSFIPIFKESLSKHWIQFLHAYIKIIKILYKLNYILSAKIY